VIVAKRGKRSELAAQCLEICREYAAQGLKMTARQVYYALVAKGLLENGQNFYRKVIAATSQARLNGTFPIDMLEDRGRTVNSIVGRGQFDIDWAHESLGESIKRAPLEYLYTQKWFGQPNLVSTWVEKEALAGVFEEPCRSTGAGLFACKGYPSLSALWQWCTQIDDILTLSSFADGQLALEQGDGDHYQEIHVLYFGDHDPDGLEIPRVAEEQLKTIISVHGHRLRNTPPPIKFHRIALTLAQIQQHNPPPFPAKQTSSRYDKYVAETGLDDAWELDALPPNELQRLIRQEVGSLWDQDIHQTFLDYVGELRSDFKDRITEEWLAGLLEE
jgi:hypothetical protein